MYIQCKPKDVQSLQSSYFLFFYHFGFETTTLTFSRIIDFDDTTNLFFKQVYSCTVVEACLIWTDLIFWYHDQYVEKIALSIDTLQRKTTQTTDKSVYIHTPKCWGYKGDIKHIFVKSRDIRPGYIM